MRLGMCAALRNPYPSMSRQPLVAAKVPEGVIGDLSIRELDNATLEPMSPIRQHRRLQWSTSHVINAPLVEVRIDIASPRVLSEPLGGGTTLTGAFTWTCVPRHATSGNVKAFASSSPHLSSRPLLNTESPHDGLWHALP